MPSYKLGSCHLPFSADCPLPLSVVAGSRSCEILVLEWRVTERLSFFKVESAGSAVLAPLLKIICFHAQCSQCLCSLGSSQELSYPLQSRSCSQPVCGDAREAEGLRRARCHPRRSGVTAGLSPPGLPGSWVLAAITCAGSGVAVFRVSSFAEGFERISLPNGLNYSHGLSPVTG